MKRTFIFISLICIVAAFWVGRLSGPAIPANNADGILAYQHYYEVAEQIIGEDSITDDVVKSYVIAKKQLDDYKAGHIMTWPEICDQRDMLSDIIRMYAKEENDNIMKYVKVYFDDPSILDNWAYSY